MIDEDEDDDVGVGVGVGGISMYGGDNLRVANFSLFLPAAMAFTQSCIHVAIVVAAVAV